MPRKFSLGDIMEIAQGFARIGHLPASIQKTASGTILRGVGVDTKYEVSIPSGSTKNVTLITALRSINGALQYRSVLMSFNNGIATLSNESDWIDVPVSQQAIALDFLPTSIGVIRKKQNVAIMQTISYTQT